MNYLLIFLLFSHDCTCMQLKVSPSRNYRWQNRLNIGLTAVSQWLIAALVAIASEYLHMHKISHSKDTYFTEAICLVLVYAGHELASVIGLVSDECLTVSMHSQSGHLYPFLIPIQECWMLCHRAKCLKSIVAPFVCEKNQLEPWVISGNACLRTRCPQALISSLPMQLLCKYPFPFPVPCFSSCLWLCKHFAFWHAIPTFSMLFSLFNWI